jgi:hypothetical protein
MMLRSRKGRHREIHDAEGNRIAAHPDRLAVSSVVEGKG